MTFQQWQDYSLSLHRRADAVHAMIIARARKVTKDAGLDPKLLGIHPHNAMCSFNAGKPWPNVDYSLVRRSLWLQRKSWEPTELARRISNRAWETITR